MNSPLAVKGCREVREHLGAALVFCAHVNSNDPRKNIVNS